MSILKHSASVMPLDFVASNGAFMFLIRFPTRFRLTAWDYEVNSAEQMIPWIRNTHYIHLLKTFFTQKHLSVTIMLQQDDASAHTSYRMQNFLLDQNFSFQSRNLWQPFSLDVNPLDQSYANAAFSESDSNQALSRQSRSPNFLSSQKIL